MPKTTIHGTTTMMQMTKSAKGNHQWNGYSQQKPPSAITLNQENQARKKNGEIARKMNENSIRTEPEPEDRTATTMDGTNDGINSSIHHV